MSTMDIHSVISKSILAASMVHFKIIAIVGDGAQCNRQFQNRLFTKIFKKGNDVIYEKLMIHSVTTNPIFYISDPSHMVKKIVSSLSSNNRNIFMNVTGTARNLSLSSMMILWMSFNNNSGLNEHHDFKIIDFVKNSFQAMRVGPCIKASKYPLSTLPSYFSNIILLTQLTTKLICSRKLGSGSENDCNDRPSFILQRKI